MGYKKVRSHVLTIFREFNRLRLKTSNVSFQRLTMFVFCTYICFIYLIHSVMSCSIYGLFIVSIVPNVMSLLDLYRYQTISVPSKIFPLPNTQKLNDNGQVTRRRYFLVIVISQLNYRVRGSVSLEPEFRTETDRYIKISPFNWQLQKRGQRNKHFAFLIMSILSK